MAQEMAPIHCLASKLEEQSIELQQSADRIQDYLGLPSEPCEEPAAGGPSLQAKVVRAIQTQAQAICTLARLERELNYEGVEPPKVGGAIPTPSRG